MKFVIASGGTGGHIIPALRVGLELKKDGHQVEFAGVFKSFHDKIAESGFSVKELPSVGFSIKNLFGFLLCMNKALKESRIYLEEFCPDVVLGFGGYGAFPVVMEACLLKYPTLMHEQNVIPGKANRILSRFVKKIAISFPQSRKFFGLTPAVLTGCPCNFPTGKSKRDIIEGLGLKEDRITILVSGGSQGSQKINKEFSQVVDLIKPKVNLQIIHLSGKTDCDWLKQEYTKQGIPFCVFDFYDNISELYEVSDLVVARAGAVTVSEIALFALPAIFIPYPYAQKHQKENASVLERIGMAIIIEESVLSTPKLCSTVLEMIQNQKDFALKKGQAGLKELQLPEAAKTLAKAAMELKQ